MHSTVFKEILKIATNDFLSYYQLWLIMTSMSFFPFFFSFHFLTSHFSLFVNVNLKGANTYYNNILNRHLTVWWDSKRNDGFF